MIRNRGIVEPDAISMLGVSGSRYSNNSNVIGTFGSGSKHAIALFLRYGINPYIITGNLHMQFYTEPKFINGRIWNAICVKYSGKDHFGNTKNNKEQWNVSTEWGINWDNLNMGIREFVANAIDASYQQGLTHNDIEIKIVDKPRATSGYTAVFLPYNSQIELLYKTLPLTFLHFRDPLLLNKKLLPKMTTDKTFIYKKGVLVAGLNGKSVYDYNLGDELTLDETRNCSVYVVQHAASKAIAKSSRGEIARIYEKIFQDTNNELFESKLNKYDLMDSFSSEEERKQRIAEFTAAWDIAAGKNAVVCSENNAVAEFAKRKGYKPVVIPSNWKDVSVKYGIRDTISVLDGIEKDGVQESEPTASMIEAVDKVWNLLTSFQLTNNKEKPKVKSFSPIMSGESQTLGMYKNGIVYLHTDLDGFILLQTALEEVVHHTSGATDGSRDIQDYLLRLITKIAF
jgi:hypothetical protein